MTFKHAKFEDSVIMRSLERVAKEKGMIKDEPLKKTAATQIDLTPSNSLMQNILNLCAGLRVSGFDKYADELESNYLAYKQATSSGLYDTDPKAGEKEVQTAHPDGSHQLEGVIGDSLVEDILDKHLKMLEIVDKKPHGKLESSSSVLSAVKKALGQAVVPAAAPVKPATPQAPKTPEQLVDAGVAEIRKAVNLIVEQSDVGRHAAYIKDYLKDLESDSKNVTTEGLMTINADAARILLFASTGNEGALSRYTSSWLNWIGSSITDKPLASYDGMKNLLDGGFQMDPELLKQAIRGINNGIKLFKDASSAISAKYKESETTPATAPAGSPESNQVLTKIKEAQMDLAGIMGLVNVERRTADPKEVAEVDRWIKETLEDLTKLEKTYATMKPEVALAALAKLTSDFPRVKQDWS